MDDSVREKTHEVEGKTITQYTLRKGNEYHYFYRTYLANEKGDAITPEVTTINHNFEYQVFRLQDKISIDERITCSITFYIDAEGNPISPVYTDITDEFIDMPFDNNKDFVKNYAKFTFGVIKDIRDRIIEQNEAKDQDIFKLALNKKGIGA